MPYFPSLEVPQTSQLTTQVFYGYDANIRGRDGSFKDMRNMSLRHYPLISTRTPRRAVQSMFSPGGLIAKDALYWVDDGAFYANGQAVVGLDLTDGDKQLISMGAYIIIWPDKKYVNTQDLTDFGSIDHAYEYTGDVTLTLCRQDGDEYELEDAILSDAAPEDPTNGQLWIDTSESIHILNQYSEALGEWAQIATVYIKISAPGIGMGFSTYDGVTISGIEYAGEDEGIKEQVEALNADAVIQAAGDDFVVVVGIIDQVQTVGGVSIKRQCPDMDFLCESNNRLWGCHYGLVNGKPVNEIYASKLGDFKNWKTFMGLSTDSYTVSLGTDGKFTGAVNYQGMPLFFKETCLHRVHGTAPSSFQVQTTLCRGVQDGSHKSLCQVGEVLYYKGRTEVLSYDGSLPQSISQAFGEENYTAGVAGSIGNLYYLSMLDKQGEPLMFVFDRAKNTWCVEDGVRPKEFAQLDDDLYFITDNSLMATAGGEEDITWRLDTATMGFEYPEHKYLSKWLVRAAASAGARIRFSFMYDSSGYWHDAGEYTGHGLARSFTVPIIPRRCDHMQLRIEGTGDFKLFSLSRVLEKGGDPLC